MPPEMRPKSFGTFEKQVPERDSNPGLCDAGAVLYQLTCQANYELKIMWVDCKPIDEGFRSLPMMSIHESHEFELQGLRRGHGSNLAQA